MPVCVCICFGACVSAYVRTCMRVCVLVYVCVRARVCVCTDVCTCTIMRAVFIPGFVEIETPTLFKRSPEVSCNFHVMRSTTIYSSR